MTQEFLGFSKEVYSKPEEIIMCIEKFIKENTSRLEDTINDPNSNFYYSQPEILLILERLSNKKILLKKKWIELYPLEVLEEIATDWGISLD